MAGAGAAPVRQRLARAPRRAAGGAAARARADGDGTHVAETTSSNVRGPDTHQKEPAPRAGHVKGAADRAPPNLDGDPLRGVVHAHYPRLLPARNVTEDTGGAGGVVASVAAQGIAVGGGAGLLLALVVGICCMRKKARVSPSASNKARAM